MVAPTPSTSPLQGASQFVFDPRTRRYRSVSSGRFLAEKTVRAAVDTIIQKESANFREIASNLNSGKINLAEFQLQMAAGVKKLHVSMGLAAVGGINNVSNADLGFLANLVKEQYQFLRGMAKDIKQGKQKLDGTLQARVELYAQSARGTHEKVRERAARIGGMKEQRSILGAADHCSSCLSEAKKEWQPIGSLIPIGQRICKARCHCTMLYR